MQVIAMGRLGMREFDLGSDADIVFFLDDGAAADHDRWTQVAERLIEIISTYTREGFIFAVDTRLRPMGRDGELVQIASRYKRYFEEIAEPWEAVTYMKARTVAGNIPVVPTRSTNCRISVGIAGEWIRNSPACWSKCGNASNGSRVLLTRSNPAPEAITILISS